MSGTLAAVLGAVYLGLLLAKAAGAAAAIRRSRARLADAVAGRGGAPAVVAVLQPILSGDPALASTLADNVVELPHATFHWLVDDDDREARRIVDALRQRFPARDLRIASFASAPGGVNPKTFKLAAALEMVDASATLVLDDDARLPRASLEQMLAELAHADLVTALPCYRDGANLPSRLLAQFANNNAALTYLPLLPFAPPVSINGMCYLVATEPFAKSGGFAPLLRALADDLAVAQALRSQGRRIVQSTARVEMETTVESLRRYVRQMHRWLLFATLLLREQNVRWQLAIGLLHGLPPVLLAALVALAIAWPAPLTLGSLAAAVVVRAVVLARLQSVLTGRVRHRPLLSLVSELLQPLHLLHAALVRRIRWRSRHYRVRSNHDFRAV